jgi:hypothetical protein
VGRTKADEKFDSCYILFAFGTQPGRRSISKLLTICSLRRLEPPSVSSLDGSSQALGRHLPAQFNAFLLLFDQSHLLLNLNMSRSW